MNDKYEKLVELCPNLYKDRHGDMRRTCMCWGFCVGLGWLELIKDLSIKLEELIVKYIEENPNDEWPPRAVQVKEKFGTLRYYMSSETDEMSKLINKAENDSGNICETCGEVGYRVNDYGWYKTICKTCEIKEELEDSIQKDSDEVD